MTMAASARKTKASGDERPAADEVGALVAGEVVLLAVLLAEVLEWVVDKVVPVYVSCSSDVLKMDGLTARF
jgi:hypothetical protein